MRYPLYNKYAMPVDPRVLKKDFESKGIESIPELLSLLKETTLNNHKRSIERITYLTNQLWFNINEGKGINLRDREKLIPVFQEYSRIFGDYEDRPNKVYRGVTMPLIYPKILTETFGQTKPKKPVNIDKHPEVKKVLESLAYGLRSYSVLKGEGYNWAYNFRTYPHDKSPDVVLFVYKKPNIIFDCNAYFSVVGEEEDIRPFDPGEVLCYSENPKIISVERSYNIGWQDTSLWKVEVK